ncbi:MAG: cupredoxin domain-containing protein [Acidimicrobiia bacterium]|nr:cupredoxin domain-containing protein [Acidimicrobiia bacterium]
MGPASNAPSGATVGVTISTDTDAELKFDPAELTVQAGADVRVTFENRASVPHNLTFQDPINVATSTVVAPGTSETVPVHGPLRWASTHSSALSIKVWPGSSSSRQIKHLR